MTDRTTKALLFAIACALWIQIAGAWLRPTPVLAQTSELAAAAQWDRLSTHLQNISSDTGSMKISLQSLVVADDLRRRPR